MLWSSMEMQGNAGLGDIIRLNRQSAILTVKILNEEALMSSGYYMNCKL